MPLGSLLDKSILKFPNKFDVGVEEVIEIHHECGVEADVYLRGPVFQMPVSLARNCHPAGDQGGDKTGETAARSFIAASGFKVTIELDSGERYVATIEQRDYGISDLAGLDDARRSLLRDCHI